MPTSVLVFVEHHDYRQILRKKENIVSDELIMRNIFEINIKECKVLERLNKFRFMTHCGRDNAQAAQTMVVIGKHYLLWITGNFRFIAVHTW